MFFSLSTCLGVKNDYWTLFSCQILTVRRVVCGASDKEGYKTATLHQEPRCGEWRGGVYFLFICYFVASGCKIIYVFNGATILSITIFLTLRQCPPSPPPQQFLTEQWTPLPQQTSWIKCRSTHCIVSKPVKLYMGLCQNSPLPPRKIVSMNRPVAIVIEKRGMFWEGGVDSVSLAYSCGKVGYILRGRGRFWNFCIFWECGILYRFWKGGIFWEGGVDSVSFAYRPSCGKEGYFLRGRGRFWNGCISMFKKGVYSWREG